MNYEYEQTPFSKAMLTGLFAGIFASVTCLVFEMVYREITEYTPSGFINVSTTIFVINLFLFICGILYFYLHKAGRIGNLIFILGFLLLTIIGVLGAERIQRFEAPLENIQFHTMFIGILLITGVSAFFLIPFLFNNKWFNKHVV